MTETLAKLKNMSKAIPLPSLFVNIVLLSWSHDRSSAPFCFSHVKGFDSLNPGINKS